ncbi:MAG: isopentenyl-diphosphate delta-isomerase [Chlamydiae bacterium]|nr:MAG: isopentenyl-diphosphate delta-isomerase [Chlamydiota bacterium]
MVINQKETQFVLEVDCLDQPLRLVEKHEAHFNGILHRAFSIFVFRQLGTSLQLLLQQRAFGKYHSEGLWTNTCCSHAGNDSLEKIARNRLQTEMGFSCELHPAGSFYYKADVGNGMMEHEIDHVFVGLHNPQVVQPNPEEVQDYQWRDVETLLELSSEQRKEFTVWFFQVFELALKFIKLHEWENLKE